MSTQIKNDYNTGEPKKTRKDMKIYGTQLQNQKQYQSDNNPKKKEK